MLELAIWLKKNGFRADQVQAFLPSPMASATAMYHSGKNPLRRVTRSSEDVPIAKGLRQRRLHKAFLRYHDPNNWPVLREALRRMGRANLIGSGPQSSDSRRTSRAAPDRRARAGASSHSARSMSAPGSRNANPARTYPDADVIESYRGARDVRFAGAAARRHHAVPCLAGPRSSASPGPAPARATPVRPTEAAPERFAPDYVQQLARRLAAAPPRPRGNVTPGLEQLDLRPVPRHPFPRRRSAVDARSALPFRSTCCRRASCTPRR